MSLKLKKLDKLVVTSFWGPYLVSFVVAEFVLIMQFMWKYIDDILGKGFPIFNLMELIFYYAVQLIPMAIPLTILISSIMVFGNLSERYELTSIKSAGISFFRIIRAAIVIAVCTAAFSYISSNNLRPKAYYQFYKIFRSITGQKPSLSLEEGIFNSDFKDYIIRIGVKDKDDMSIHDIMIYDHTNIDRRLVNVIYAKDGVMYNKGSSFIMDLYDGYQYKESKVGFGNNKRDNYPLTRTSFKRFTKVFDMSQFELDINDISTSRRKHDMLNHAQLSASLDTFEMRLEEKQGAIKYEYSNLFDLYPDQEEREIIPQEAEEDEDSDEAMDRERKNKMPASARSKSIDATIAKLKKEIGNKPKKTVRKTPVSSYGLMLQSRDSVTPKTFYEWVHPERRVDVLDATIKDATGFRQNYTDANNQVISLSRQIELYKHRIHQQFSWAAICIVFLFIGAPLGSIIRKGGYGYPLLVAIIFYVTFVITHISGDKLVRRGTLSAEAGAWLPILILAPIAVLLTYLALRDKKINPMAFINRFIPAKKESEPS